MLRQPGVPEGSEVPYHDPVQQLLLLEDMLLLSRYEEAAQASLTLVPRFSGGGKASDSLLQRVLVTAFQAHFFIGRQDDVDALVDSLGPSRLAVPTFMAWYVGRALLLLESGQAAAARLRVEQYMATLMTLMRHKCISSGVERQHRDQDPNPDQDPRRGGYQTVNSTSATTAMEAPLPPPTPTHSHGGADDAAAAPPSASPPVDGSGTRDAAAESAGGDADVGAAAASLQDRAALARLYTQDVLCLGLGRPLEALQWLQQPRAQTGAHNTCLPAEQPSQHHHHHQQQWQRQFSVGKEPSGCTHPLQGRSKAAAVAATEAAAAAGTGTAEAGSAEEVNAVELLGGCEDTLQQLRDELKRLIAISGLTPPEGLPDEGTAAAAAATTAGGGGRGSSEASTDSASAAGATGLAMTNSSSGTTRKCSSDTTVKGGVDGNSGRLGRSARDGTEVVQGCRPSLASQLLMGIRAGPSSGATASATAARALSFLRTLAAAMQEIIRRLIIGTGVQLTRAQSWIVCKAAAVAAHLRVKNSSNSRSTGGNSLWCSGSVSSLGRVAVAMAMAAVVLVAAQAEAPYVRTNVERQLGRLTRMVGEAVRMGLSLHPSPVATAGFTQVAR
ncbi:hypothetical protein VOLCADRAFT_91340 [Volvox carteri f. nagariensis]|uniref:Uncharacterized protein n=1 Tax=Volvox carteri f. nagariensis TaxID=3068 RepID=D8TWT6_VOLCA|nr:uncharacterized protein VOLCADRAFT_91340 [Volvox carteri f. nagariensis]EFJ48208.1 hypothetical protein VOLCADRAFT_91340 [Volvox carteri f. nagariensis]|eukprot:XP_002950893.1 hypothetical protein VOLCADRAFT_91340 [Volvox carteri f. nagariensis]